MDPITISALIGAGTGGLNFFGNLFGNRTANSQRQQMIDMARQAGEYFRGQGISDPQMFMSSAYNPLLTFASNLLGDGNASAWLNDYLQQTTGANYDRYSRVPLDYMQPGSLQQFYQSPLGDVGRSYDSINNFIQQQLFNLPTSGGYSTIRDLMSGLGSGQDQGVDALLQRGNNLMDQWGTTAHNMSAQDRAGDAMSRGGMAPQFQQLFNAGNDLFSTGGMNPQLEALMAASQGATQGGGYGPQTQSIFDMGRGIAGAGGYTPSINNLTRYGSTLQNFLPGGSSAATQASMLGPYGQQAMSQMLNPSSGYNAQNAGVGNLGFEGLRQLLARDPQLDQTSAFGQQAFSGKLPGAGSDYDAALQGLIGQLSGGGGGFVGGGGASGASAGGMIAMDPDLQAMLTHGKDLFLKDSLIPMSQRISMAIDQSETAAAQRAEAAQRFARARGGGGAIINAGSQNQAMTDFADQALRAKAEAVRQAMLDQQQLQLQQQMQGGQIGIGASNADTNRQQVAASRDIASANNATQASVANAQMSTQAALANAQLRNAALQAATQAALGARGQDYSRSQAGLQAMLDTQGLANQRGSIFNDAMKTGLSDATQRYGIDAQRLAAALQGAVGASGQAGNQNTAMAQLMAQLALGGEQQATARQGQGLDAMLGAGNQANQRFGMGLQGIGSAAGLGTQNVGMGLNAMQGAGGLANTALNTWGNIGNAGAQDQLARMGLGANMVGQNIQGRLSGLDLLGRTENSMNNNLLNLGQLYNQSAGTQAGLWRGMFDMDFANRQLGQQGYRDFFGNAANLGGMAGNFFQLATNPLSQFANNMVNYMGQQQGNYANIIGGLSRYQTPQYRNEIPQLSINPSQWFPTNPMTPPFNPNSNPVNTIGQINASVGRIPMPPLQFPSTSYIP